MKLINVKPEIDKLYNISSKNLGAVLSFNKESKKEDLLTRVSIKCVEEIEKSKLSFWHPVKKLLATSLTYTLGLATPVVALTGAAWRYGSAITDLEVLAGASPALVAIFLADWSLGKTLKIRPITAIAITILDSYRHATNALSKQVKDSYTKQEEHVKALTDKDREIIKEELKMVFEGIAAKMATFTDKNNKRGEIIEKLEPKLPFIKKALSELKLSDVQIAQILSPLEDTVAIIEAMKPSKLKIS
jgi:hypothetical protein